MSEQQFKNQNQQLQQTQSQKNNQQISVPSIRPLQNPNQQNQIKNNYPQQQQRNDKGKANQIVNANGNGINTDEKWEIQYQPPKNYNKSQVKEEEGWIYANPTDDPFYEKKKKAGIYKKKRRLFKF